MLELFQLAGKTVTIFLVLLFLQLPFVFFCLYTTLSEGFLAGTVSLVGALAGGMTSALFLYSCAFYYDVITSENIWFFWHGAILLSSLLLLYWGWVVLKKSRGLILTPLRPTSTYLHIFGTASLFVLLNPGALLLWLKIFGLLETDLGYCPLGEATGIVCVILGLYFLAGLFGVLLTTLLKRCLPQSVAQYALALIGVLAIAVGCVVGTIMFIKT